MHRYWWIIAAALVAGLVGCRGAQPSDGFADVSLDVAQRTGHSLQWNRDADAAEAIEQRVNELLAKPLTIDAAVQVALINNRGLQATIEELGVARADLIEAGMLQNPQLGVSARFPDTSGSTNLEFTVAQSFLEFFVVGARKELSAAQFEHARLRVTQAVLELAWETESAFHAGQASQQTLALKRTIGEAEQLKRDLATKQRDAGNISELDAARQQAAAAQSQLAVTMAGAELQSRREKLNRLMGLAGGQTSWTLSEETPAIPTAEPDVDALEHLALMNRIELAIARQELTVVDRTLELNRKGFVSDLELGISAEREPEGFWVTGPVLQIELPIFDHRGVRTERIEAQQRQARHMLAAMETDALSEVREAAGQLMAARATVEYLQTEVTPLRQRIVKLSQEHYDAMLLGVYELLSARQDEVEAQGALIDAMRDYWTARTTLKQAVGGSLPKSTSPAQN
jgi:cobalt-zinc-cadmium efflux system outer membrane protein